MRGAATGPAPPAPRKRVAILQSNYAPWKGVFDMIRRVDEFILFDDVQFTRRDWRNRNQIKTPQGRCWLTIPVLSKSRYTQNICETAIADANWAEQHWQLLRQNYARSPQFGAAGPVVQSLLERAAPLPMLSEVNAFLLQEFCGLLGIATKLTRSMDYAVTGQKTDRLLALCRAAGADAYLSGPAARAYIEPDRFKAAGIALDYMSYDHYPVYPQLHGAFDHHVSILDAFLMLGDQVKTVFPDSSAPC